MGQPYLSARVITSRVKTTPSTTDNMRCFILLALIAAASASCVNRVRTTHQQPAVQRSHSSSSTSSCFHAPQQIYRPQPAPVYAPCYAPCYGCTGTYVSASDSSSKTYSAEPAVYEETIVPCDDPVDADPVQITKSVSNTESKSSSTKSTSNATKEVTRTSTTHC